MAMAGVGPVPCASYFARTARRPAPSISVKLWSSTASARAARTTSRTATVPARAPSIMRPTLFSTAFFLRLRMPGGAAPLSMPCAASPLLHQPGADRRPEGARLVRGDGGVRHAEGVGLAVLGAGLLRVALAVLLGGVPGAGGGGG